MRVIEGGDRKICRFGIRGENGVCYGFGVIRSWTGETKTTQTEQME